MDPIEISGTATDNVGVSSVTFLLQNRDTLDYLRLDGSLGAAERFTASLSNPGSTSTNFAASVDVPVGEWQIVADALDAATLRDRRSVLFSVVGDAAPPTIEITSGADQRIDPGATFTLTGTAQADATLEAVEVLVRQPLDFTGVARNGALGPVASWFRLPGNNGTTSSDWTYTSVPLPTGTYDVRARVIDAFGVVSLERTSVVVGPVDDATPEVTIDAATRFQQELDSLEVTLTGGATDDNGVTAVAARIWDSNERAWVQTDGTYATTPDPFDATLAAPGATSTDWTFTFQPPQPSTYTLTFFAIDTAGLLDPAQLVGTARIYPGDLRPTVTVLQPTNNQEITTNRILATGSANDDNQLGRIEVRIQNLDTGLFLREDDTFGTSQWIDAAQTNPGADRTNWDYSSPVLPDGNYRLQVRSFDTNDQTSPNTNIVLTLN